MSFNITSHHSTSTNVASVLSQDTALQVKAGSDALSIKRKYKELAVALHPDKCKVSLHHCLSNGICARQASLRLCAVLERKKWSSQCKTACIVSAHLQPLCLSCAGSGIGIAFVCCQLATQAWELLP